KTCNVPNRCRDLLVHYYCVWNKLFKMENDYLHIRCLAIALCRKSICTKKDWSLRDQSGGNGFTICTFILSSNHSCPYLGSAIVLKKSDNGLTVAIVHMTTENYRWMSNEIVKE